ncbi:RNaseH domain-containing protein [Streptomyces platensis]|uniref:RNaseH domain-containing protein n=1 Tax=Streptomyces platensis TaxID=58346 RepID=UPI00378DF6F7
MSTYESRLALAGLCLDRTLLGGAWLYPLPDKVEKAWLDLREEYYGATSSKANLPYEGLLMVLRASGHTSASLYPTTKKDPPRFLALSRRLDPAHLRNAIVLWEQALLLKPAESVTLGYASVLADLISEIEPEYVELWDHLRLAPRSVDADSWVFAAAAWNLGTQLAKTPLSIDGREISLRVDTDGNLLAWSPEDMWHSTWHAARPDKKDQDEGAGKKPEVWKTERRSAALRVEVGMKSFSGLATPLLVLHPKASRLSNTLRNTRTAWLAPKSPTAPLLRLDLNGKGEHTHLDHTSRVALDAWVRLRDEPVFPREPGETEFLPLRPSAMDLSGQNGNLRALIPTAGAFPIGRGVGLHTVATIARHAEDVLGTPLLRADQFVRTLSSNARKAEYGRDETLLDDLDLPHIIESAGASRLRILALYQHQEMRTRMQRLLAYHFNKPELANGMPEDQVVELGCQTEVVFHCAPELLAHGPDDKHTWRRELVDAIPHLEAPGTGVLALCETLYDARAWSRQRRERKFDKSLPDPDALDAKPHVSRYLAQRGVLAQFLNHNFKPRRSKKTERDPANALEALGMQLASDYPGHSAVGDMLRAAGLVHPRLTRAISYGPHALKESVTHVGLHLREQLGDRRGPVTEPPKLMWTLVAFIPRDGLWEAYAYLPPAPGRRSGWFPYAQAQAIHRGAELPQGRRQDEQLPRHIDHALKQLGQNDYILYVSGRSTRSLWPRLANKNFDTPLDDNGCINGKPALPGLTLPQEFRPRAVIRSTAAGPDLALPAFPEKVYADGKTTCGKSDNALYSLGESDSTFLMCNTPHQTTGKTFYAKSGFEYGRWHCDNPEEQAETWYNLNATEIAVLHHPAQHSPSMYALTAAKLCNHPLAWSHRTQHPLPIHAAIQMDKDHPDYRRTIDWNADEE